MVIIVMERARLWINFAAVSPLAQIRKKKVTVKK